MKNPVTIKKSKGFSLPEMLIVIAILGVLLALVTPNLIAAQKQLRQKELDAFVSGRAEPDGQAARRRQGG